MRVADLRGMLTYVPRFRDKVFVLAIDGEIIAQENFSNILLDLAVLRSLNIRIVIVHGAAYQTRELAQKSGKKITSDDGIGVTDETTLDVAVTAATRVTHDIMEGLATADLRAAYANAIIAHPYGIIGGTDHLFTGRIERVDTDLLTQLLEKDITPIIPPLGFDGEGRTFRINSDSVAIETAKALKAVKLIYLAPYTGISNQKKLVTEMSMDEADDYLKKNRADLPASLASKLEHSVKACREGVGRTHIIDGRKDEALLTEVFSNEGVGTMIYVNEYQQVRRALKKDVGNILSLIKKSVDAEEIVKRTRADVLAQLQDYYVFEIDRNVVGCVAMHPYEQNCAELACLCVSSGHENQGIGSILTQFVENAARDKGIKQLMALSTHAFNFFQQKAGFSEGSPDLLPQTRREKYDQSGRKSKILYKKLG